MHLWPDLLLTAGREASGHLVRVAAGRIVAIEPATPPTPRPPTWSTCHREGIDLRAAFALAETACVRTLTASCRPA